MLYSVVKPLLFILDPEFSHDLTFNVLKVLDYLKFFDKKDPLTTQNSVNCFGLSFPNPIGLAAGLDKNAQCLNAWQAMGFGFIEVGTVTPKPQLGNSKPRLFRLPKDNALINRMGFNNKGVDYLVEQMKKWTRCCPIGINIGKNKDTTNDNAPLDYLNCFEKVYPYADYVTVNISSPNTPGLRDFQHGSLLKSIIAPLKDEQQKLSDKTGKYVPILVKISPDMEATELQFMIDSLVKFGVEGVIATNTTIKRAPHLKDDNQKEEGGLSGEPLFASSTQVIRTIFQQVGDALPIIAVGGISRPEQAKEKLAAGAKLIQLYTGLIYQGPGLIKQICNVI